jgi:hypothetical protein
MTMPESLTATQARETLAHTVREVRKQRKRIRIGRSPETAKSEICPLPVAGSVAETIDIDFLRRNFSTKRREVEVTGASFQIIIRGEPIAEFRPTRRARSTIAKARTRLSDGALTELASKIDDLHTALKEGARQRNIIETKIDRLLEFADIWRRRWRIEHGYSGEMIPLEPPRE